jgi:hypothetical protein
VHQEDQDHRSELAEEHQEDLLQVASQEHSRHVQDLVAEAEEAQALPVHSVAVARKTNLENLSVKSAKSLS